MRSYTYLIIVQLNMHNYTEFTIVELFHLLWIDCVIVNNDGYCIGACPQLFIEAIILELSLAQLVLL